MEKFAYFKDGLGILMLKGNTSKRYRRNKRQHHRKMRDIIDNTPHVYMIEIHSLHTK